MCLMHIHLFFPFIISHNRFRYPFGQRLPVVLQYKALLVAAIPDISQFQVYTRRSSIPEHIQSTFTNRSSEATIRLMPFVFLLKRIPHPVGQSLTLLTAWSMI